MTASPRAWAALLSLLAMAPVAAQTHPDSAVVQIRVNRDYDDSPASLRLIRLLVQFAPSRTVLVRPEDKSLDAIFVREYGFGPSNLKKSYDLIVAAILERNNLTRPEDILAHATLNIPAIPSRVNKDWGRQNLRNYVANSSYYTLDSAKPAAAVANRRAMSLEETVAGAVDKARDLAYRTIKNVNPGSDNAPMEVVAYEMPVKAAAAINNTPDFELVGIRTAYPMAVKLAGPPAPAPNPCDTEPAEHDHAALTAAQRKAISGLLAANSTRSPVVFILDTGWPSFDAYQESRAALNDVLDAVWRSNFGLPFTPSPALAAIPPASNGHCRCIERALKELRALDQSLDPAKRVRVIYLPLTREQGSDAVLADLIQTYNLLLRVSTDQSLTPVPQPPSTQALPVTQAIADAERPRAMDIVRQRLPLLWQGNQVNTDSSLLNAILAIGQSYADAKDTVFFANASWTIVHDGPYKYVFFDNPQFGVVTAAAGNDGSTALLDFAQRSLRSHDTTAILETDGADVVATSNRMEPGRITSALSTGFDGRVLDGTSAVNGNSFSAPRVAWFLAAGEAVRKIGLDRDNWDEDLSKQLLGMNPNGQQYKRLLFDPVKYISIQAGK